MLDVFYIPLTNWIEERKTSQFPFRILHHITSFTSKEIFSRHREGIRMDGLTSFPHYLKASTDSRRSLIGIQTVIGIFTSSSTVNEKHFIASEIICEGRMRSKTMPKSNISGTRSNKSEVSITS